jgi:putative hydrolase of the HAD superfamily
MSIARRYAAISFDVGYTLIQPLGEAPVIVAGLLAELGVAADDDALAAAHHRAERLFLSDYLRPLNDTWEADERINHLYLRYYGQWLAELGVADPEARHAQTIIDRYLDPANWRLYPQVLETLGQLHQQGYRLGIASDWVSGLPRILHSLGLSRYLDWALVSGAIGFAKPSPQFYRLVLARAGVRPEQIVHVGDSYYADVRGARTVGMDAILLDWRRRSWSRLDVPLIHELAALPPLLAAQADSLSEQRS